MIRVKSKTLRVNSLNSDTIEEMFQLYERYYSHVSREVFRQDLREKTHVFMLYERRRNAAGKSRLIGFSTIMRKRLPSLSRALFIYSGDTVIEREYWGTKDLQKAFFWFILRTKVGHPFSSVYWMLISKGFKTYMMMRRNFPRSFPQPNRQAPAHINKARDEFYSWKFGPLYNRSSGLIRFDGPSTAVKNEFAHPSEEATRNPEISFFLRTNPDFHLGTELACIAAIEYRGFLSHLRKYFLPPLAGKGLTSRQTNEIPHS